MSYLGQGLGLGREERFTATATAGQTTVTVGDDGRSISYTPNYVDVYLNGVKMVNGSDITVTSGTSIVFASALAAGDIVDIVAPGYFQPADTVSRSLGGTFLGAVNLPSGGLNVGSGQLRVDSSGRVLKSSQPAFYAWMNAASQSFSADAAILFNAARFNIGGHFNTATGRFTAPVSGIYMFTATIMNDPDGVIEGKYFYFTLNNSRVNGRDIVEATGDVPVHNEEHATWIASLAAFDVVDVRSSGSGTFSGSNDGAGYRNEFSGYLLG